MADFLPPYPGVSIDADTEIPGYTLDEKKITEILHDENTQKSVSDEIAKLSKLTLSVEESFHAVEDLLQRLISSPKYPSTFRGRFDGLSRKWSTYRKEYTSLLWESRTVAGKAHSDARIFYQTVIPWLQKDNVNVAEKIAGLDGYIKSLEKNVKNSETLSQKYSDLKRNVMKFSEEWDETIESCKGEIAIINSEVDALDEEIHELGRAIQGLKKKIGVLWGACATAVGGAGVAMLLGAICPLTWIVILAGAAAVAAGGAIYYYHVKRKHDQLNEARNEKLRQRERLCQNLETMEELHYSLESTAPEIQHVIDTIGTFAQVWNMICMDAQGIKDGLEKTQDLAFMPSLAKDNLEATAAMYQTLCNALYKFQTTIS
ncbi:hypothetical protein BOTBODRAFT_34810 [Botryobasidium botryosum FD-172 SS1]|uniref:Uncharacterized protein n=1 Tax=Botryobasidium botryosum (strain FD-172 SS1) TaxID=930990 RepID=A0A067M9F6_BOTB1|nr:hypothetical protein BOTBODRAFT_34810 [Botryobasidium botryosum FD-172 SS1]